MSLETFIGLRYLKAKRKQTFISLITFISLGGVAVGVTTLIVVLAVMNGFEEDLKSKILGVNSHIVLLGDQRPVSDHAEAVAEAAGVRGVKAVEPFIYTQVMIGALGGEAGGALKGVDPALSGGPNGQLERIVTRGSAEVLLEPGAHPKVILGAELARQLGVMEGDLVDVVSPLGRVTPLGGRAPRSRTFQVAGVFESGMYEYDSTLAYTSLAAAQDFLDMDHGVTGLEIRVDNIYRADRVKERMLEAVGPGYRAKDWMEMNRNLFSALKLEKTAMFIILILTVLVAALNIVSTLIMVVMEKTRDIAIVMSMGATRRMVMRVFVFQGLFIGILGTALGLIGGLGLCYLLAEYEFVKLPSDVYYVTTLPVRLQGLDTVLIAASAVAISFAATLYPAWQASRLNPAEALRYD